MAKSIFRRVVACREERGFTHENIRISVGAQKMVSSRSSGVLFTPNPVNGDRSKVAINAARGFGEGAAKPSGYHVGPGGGACTWETCR